MTAPLEDLDARIRAAQTSHKSAEASEPPKYGREMNLGIRAFMEMLGVLLGSGLMGWALDRFFGTSPACLISFVILGIVAALFNLYKLSRNLGTAIGSNSLQSTEKNARNPSQQESDRNQRD